MVQIARWLGSATALTLMACEPSIPRPAPSVRPETVVSLPAAPTLTERPYVKLHDDGTFTVEGLLREKDRMLGDTVSVRGKVVALTQCEAPPPEAPADPDAPAPIPVVPATCNPPQHLVLADEGGAERWKLYVYGTMRSPLALAKLGETMTLTGLFDIVSKDGVFLRQQGLLLLEDIPVEPTSDE